LLDCKKVVAVIKLSGAGGFGQVLQARAEEIVKDSPGRNIVAVKTCRGKILPVPCG
jgi:hypothetical protein